LSFRDIVLGNVSFTQQPCQKNKNFTFKFLIANKSGFCNLK